MDKWEAIALLVLVFVAGMDANKNARATRDRLDRIIELLVQIRDRRP